MITLFERYIFDYNIADKMYYYYNYNKKYDFQYTKEEIKNYIDNADDLDIFSEKTLRNIPALIYCINKNDLEMVEYLLKAGATLNIHSNLTMFPFPLFIAVANEFIDMIKLFIKYKINPNYRNNMKQTALLINVKTKNNKEINDLLLPITNWYYVDFAGKDIFDYLSMDYTNEIKQKYKKKYYEYIKTKKKNKFNL
jgi:ankyrin repeat protein